MHERLGSCCRSVLEPACGSGRVLEALGRRGLEVVGIDRSPEMIVAARHRLASAGVLGEIVQADITEFHLGRRFDGAVCPIDTLAHLSPGDLALHLVHMGEHLRAGARYLVQLAIYDQGGAASGIPASHWETDGEPALVVDWTTEEVDLERARTLQRSRIAIVSGPRAGEVVEELHEMTAWTAEAWGRAVSLSPFGLVGVFDGKDEPPSIVRDGTTGGLIWYELAREPY